DMKIVIFNMQVEDGIRNRKVIGVQTCALPITENIDDCDESLFKLVEDVIVGDQEADIVDTLKEKTEKLKKENRELLGDTDERIDKMVRNLSEQVEDIKEQRLKITYEDSITADLNL